MSDLNERPVGWQPTTKQLPVGADETSGIPVSQGRLLGYNFWSGWFVPILFGVMLATIVGVTFIRLMTPYRADHPVQSLVYAPDDRRMEDNGRGRTNIVSGGSGLPDQTTPAQQQAP